MRSFKKGIGEMKITRLEAIPFRVPLLAPFKWGLAGYMEAAEHVLVKVHTDEGAIGFAEAPPRPTIYGESLASILFAVRTWFDPMVSGLDPAHYEKIWAKLEAIPGNLTAKGSIDLACYDAVARFRGVPLWEMLGGASDRLPLSWMLGIRSVSEMVREAEGIRAKGIKAFKVKSDWSRKKMSKSLRLFGKTWVRMFCYMSMPIWLMMLLQPFAPLERMEEYGLAFVEEPIPVSNRQGRLKVAKRISIPIMGDESVFTPQDVAHEIDLGVVGIISIKTPRTGYTLSKKVIHLAEMAGIPCLMGTQGETGVGTLVSAQFGAARRNVSYPSEISFFLFLKDDLLEEPVPFKDGFIELSKNQETGR